MGKPLNPKMQKELHQHKKKKLHHKREERKRILRSGKCICKDCGYIGTPEKQRRGSWGRFIITAPVGIFIIGILAILSMVEGLLRLFALNKPTSILWDKSWSNYLGYAPFSLQGCRRCHTKNSMRKLCTQDGELVFDRFYRDRFLKTRSIV